MSRGKVFKVSKTWHCEVYSGKRLIMADNTGAWEPIMQAADEGARAVSLIEHWGNKLKYDWSECVWRAPRL